MAASGINFRGNMPGGMISAGGHSGHSGRNDSGRSGRWHNHHPDRDDQKQNLANLSRDPAHANDSISPIFDGKEKRAEASADSGAYQWHWQSGGEISARGRRGTECIEGCAG